MKVKLNPGQGVFNRKDIAALQRRNIDLAKLADDHLLLANARKNEIIKLETKLECFRNERAVDAVRIERLEGALKFYADPQTYSGRWEKQPDGRICAIVPTEEDNGGDRARAALAASQQHTAGSGDGVADGRQRDIVAVDHEGNPVYAISDEEFRRMNPQPSATGDGVAGES